MSSEVRHDPEIEPDRKDWTWVLERPCPECGFDAQAVRRADLADRFVANADGWTRRLEAPRVDVRPDFGVWSPLEYACHVRDVHRVFVGRVRLMLDGDDPLFDDWDQDEAAVVGAYGSQDPGVVVQELVSEAADVAELYRSVRPRQWERPGRRSNGSVFTTASIARYHLHDVEHHLADVSRAPR